MEVNLCLTGYMINSIHFFLLVQISYSNSSIIKNISKCMHIHVEGISCTSSINN